MTRFLIIFFSLYSAMHVVFYCRIRVLFAGRRWLEAAAVAFLLVMIVAPIVSRLLERNGQEGLARFAALIGFNWTGFIFLAFCGAAGMLMVDVLVSVFNRLAGLQLPHLTGWIPAVGLLAGALLLCGYGYVESRNIVIERIRIETAKLPGGTERFKIVQISDVHLGLLAGDGRLKVIAEKIQAERPDILVSTGDLIDGRSGDFTETIEIFRRIKPRYGKYAVTGNHEYYAGLERALTITQSAGFQVLRGKAVTINGLLNIAGVDDALSDRFEHERLILSSAANGLFTLLLKHRPWVSNSGPALFDLQLSGHTHGGQIFPFRYLVKLQYPLPGGYVELDHQAKLYTSRGTGTWGPQMRVLSPPELTVIEVVPTAPRPGPRPS